MNRTACVFSCPCTARKKSRNQTYIIMLDACFAIHLYGVIPIALKNKQTDTNSALIVRANNTQQANDFIGFTRHYFLC